MECSLITVYSLKDQDLVYDWTDKWLQLIALINDVTGNKGNPEWPPPPDDMDEIKYQSLRFWLLDHQTQFIPLWRPYCDYHNLFCADESYDQDELPERFFKNPFLYFYEPENLYRLAQHLGLQTGIDDWEPDENITKYIRTLMTELARRMIEFIDWIEDKIS